MKLCYFCFVLHSNMSCQMGVKLSPLIQLTSELHAKYHPTEDQVFSKTFEEIISNAIFKMLNYGLFVAMEHWPILLGMVVIVREFWWKKYLVTLKIHMCT